MLYTSKARAVRSITLAHGTVSVHLLFPWHALPPSFRTELYAQPAMSSIMVYVCVAHCHAVGPHYFTGDIHLGDLPSRDQANVAVCYRALARKHCTSVTIML